MNWFSLKFGERPPTPTPVSFPNLPLSPLLSAILLAPSALDLAFCHALPEVIKRSGERTEVKVKEIQGFPYWVVRA